MEKLISKAKKDRINRFTIISNEYKAFIDLGSDITVTIKMLAKKYHCSLGTIYQAINNLKNK